MFQSWRMKLREVEESLKVGRLEEALLMLRQGGLLDFLPAKKLAERLTILYAERAKRRAQGRDFTGGWRDLESAGSLGELPACDVARRCLIEATLQEVESLVRGGDLNDAASQLDQLEKHTVAHPRVQLLRRILRCLQSAKHLARRGKFGDAEAQLQVASSLKPDCPELQQLLQDCQTKGAQSREFSEQLYRALSEADWRQAVSAADQLLALAPEMKLAVDARKRAWEQVGANVDRAGSTHAWGTSTRRTDEASPRSAADAAPRFALWIDGVGGYLVCLADEVTLGQSAPGNQIAVPILGDLSRRHAKIRRCGEGYVLDPLHTMIVNGKIVQHCTTLNDGDELELGGGVRFRFRRPHVLSASARLDPISRHRTQPFADGVLLMAESCVLGPKWTNHVVCRDWSADVVLYRHDGELFCRSMAPIEIDGQLQDGRGRLEFNSRVVGSDFSMCLEELDKCEQRRLV